MGFFDMPTTTPLSPNEIRNRALAFAREWQGERRERAEAQTFWNEFFNVFGISRKQVSFLFGLYQKYSSLLLTLRKPKLARKRKAL